MVSPDGVAKPFIKWVGGKRQLLPELLKHLPPSFGRYYEPFVGGGALFFQLQPNAAILSDQNERLVRTYRGIRNDVDGVIRLLQSYEHSKKFFLELRAKDIDAAKNDAEVAAWFIFLNKTGYNGLYRVNQSNKFNAPYGDNINTKICDVPTLRACSVALQAAKIMNVDFSVAVETASRGDLVYFDPPYIPLSVTSSFTSYTASGFGMEEQRKLSKVARELKRRGVHVVLSNSSSEAVRELYSDGFQFFKVRATRRVNSRVNGRGHISEFIIL